jgi:phage terminase small subunit
MSRMDQQTGAAGPQLEGAYDRLDPRQQAFVDLFLELGNATRAAERAGYSAKTARAQGSRLLTNVDIQAAIAERRRPIVVERAERVGVTALRVIEELAAIAFSDMGRFTSWGRSGVVLQPIEQLTTEERRCVAEVSEQITKYGTAVRFKLHDKVRALIDLADRLGIDKATIEALFPDLTPEQRRALFMELVKETTGRKAGAGSG